MNARSPIGSLVIMTIRFRLTLFERFLVVSLRVSESSNLEKFEASSTLSFKVQLWFSSWKFPPWHYLPKCEPFLFTLWTTFLREDFLKRSRCKKRIWSSTWRLQALKTPSFENFKGFKFFNFLTWSSNWVTTMRHWSPSLTNCNTGQRLADTQQQRRPQSHQLAALTCQKWPFPSCFPRF